MKAPLRRATWDLLALAAGCAVLLLFYRHGQDFYELPAAVQIDHPAYERLRPAGLVGRLLGAAAVVAFLLNLAYLLRRRLRLLGRLGSLRAWMSAHVILGLLGGGILFLHAAFRMSSEAARWSALSVVVLVATGLIGRYLYALVPHTATGEEDPDGLRGRADRALADVRVLLGDQAAATDRLAEWAQIHQRPSRLRGLRLLVAAPLAPLLRQWRVRRWLAGLRPLEPALRTVVRAAALEILALGHRTAVAGLAAAILRNWRLVHLAAALAMVWTASRHIVSAFSQGYGLPLGPRNAWLAGLGLGAVTLGVLERRHRQRFRRGTAKAKPVVEGPPPEPPPTLHPYIDPAICMGSAACVAACPEGDILALVDGRSRLDEPTHCVGHGACAANCPVEAITLVLGSLRRGVDIPVVSAQFESSVPGVYLVGELTGMGLIRNAVRQGTQALAHLARQRAKEGPAPADLVDVCVIGAGPAGLAATLAARAHGLRCVTLEQEPDVGGTIRHYPRRKVVMTAPMDLPGWGKVHLHDVLKEDLIALWQGVVAKTGVEIRCGSKVEGLVPLDGRPGFEVQVQGGEPVRARRVVVAIGRRGTPRRLGVPGEEAPHVVYALHDPLQHIGRRVVVVGGGDSALEAAIALAEAGAQAVHLVHRRPTFDRARARNRERLQALAQAGQVAVHLEAAPVAILSDRVLLAEGEPLVADDVLVSIGGDLPTGLLQATGVRTATHFGRPLPK